MIKIYSNGNDFYNENKDFLLTNPNSEAFFRMDAPLLAECNNVEYALKVYNGSKSLLILSKKPFNLLLYGHLELCDELVDFLISNNYEIRDYLCETDLGDELISTFKRKGYEFSLSIGMDFMEAREKNLPSSDIVEHATIDDLDEIFDLACMFFADCGLKDEVHKEVLANKISNFRVIRKDGLIVSMAALGDWSDTEKKVNYVYTRRKYRGHGYAKIVVNNILNEIIDAGYIATLNVDQKNPISYHIYSSLGFKKLFSQGVYILKK